MYRVFIWLVTCMGQILKYIWHAITNTFFGAQRHDFTKSLLETAAVILGLSPTQKQIFIRSNGFVSRLKCFIWGIFITKN